MNITIGEFTKKFKIEELLILETEYWVWSLRPIQSTLGASVLSLKRECDALHAVTQAEFSDLYKIIPLIEKTLKIAFNYDVMNYLMLMMVDKQIHYHVIPRYSVDKIFEENTWIDTGWPTQPILNFNEDVALETLHAVKEHLSAIANKTLKSTIKQYKIGYTTGVFDMFHVGHLNILKRAKEQCEFLIVGVTTDELVSYKNKKAIIPLEERMKIIESVKFVDKVVVQENMDKKQAWEKYNFDVMFVGSDWQGTPKWNEFEKEFNKLGVEIIYFPYTKGRSSTQLRQIISK